ncbi:hypothetical protein AAG570_012504 [Ranatra chinensis]|uniref:BZIP domain-containing protein n=1 Tax=Ranatra chinensis TaxID=642074 RepID=A0ABD0YFZ2_9HEMI
MLKLGTPELEKLLVDQHDGLVLTTPTPTAQILFPRNVTEEQESYARGFVEALNELHHSDSSLEGNAAGASGYPALGYPPTAPVSFGFAESSAPSAIAVKDEPQTVPDPGSTPPLSPIDMECQERIKLERKRMRNRVAASKCRRRKLERIARLEDKVKSLKGENAELAGVVNKLKEQVCSLKERVMEHVHSGCQIVTGLPHFS